MVSVIIVDYKTMDDTLKYIDSFIDNVTGITGLHFIIIDNSDTPKFNEKYKRYSYRETEVVYYFTGENLGYGKGNNKGAELSKELFNDEYLIFSNNDISFPCTFDLNLVKDVFKSDSKIAVVGPNIVGKTGLPQNPGVEPTVFDSMFKKYWKNLLGPLSKPKQKDASKNGYTRWVTGAFFIAMADLFFEVGMFDPNTFLFYEELILSERLKSKGYRVFYTKDISLIHSEHKSLYASDKYEKRMLLSYKSEKYYFKKYRNVSNFTIVLADINQLLYRVLLNIKILIKRAI